MHHRAPGSVDGERDFVIALQGGTHPALLLRWDEQEHESAAACTKELAADCAGAPPKLVKLVDFRRAYARVELALLLPRLMQQPPEAGKRAVACEGVVRLVHVYQHFLEIVLDATHIRDLVALELLGLPGNLRVEKQETVAELAHFCLAEGYAFHYEVRLA